MQINGPWHLWNMKILEKFSENGKVMSFYCCSWWWWFHDLLTSSPRYFNFFSQTRRKSKKFGNFSIVYFCQQQREKQIRSAIELFWYSNCFRVREGGKIYDFVAIGGKDHFLGLFLAIKAKLDAWIACCEFKSFWLNNLLPNFALLLCCCCWKIFKPFIRH